MLEWFHFTTIAHFWFDLYYSFFVLAFNHNGDEQMEFTQPIDIPYAVAIFTCFAEIEEETMWSLPSQIWSTLLIMCNVHVAINCLCNGQISASLSVVKRTWNEREKERKKEQKEKTQDNWIRKKIEINKEDQKKKNVEKCSYSSDEMSAERKWYRCESRAKQTNKGKQYIRF